MRILKTLKEGQENYCALISWSLFFFFPQLAAAQLTHLPFNASNSSIEFSHPDPNQPSLASLDLSWWHPGGRPVQVKGVRCILKFGTPLHEQAGLSLMALPGNLLYASGGATSSMTISDDRTQVEVEVEWNNAQRMGNRLFSVLIDNQGEILTPADFVCMKMGIVEVTLIEPGKQDAEFYHQVNHPYPSPATQDIHIPLLSNAQTVDIFTESGKKVRTEAVAGKTELTLDVTAMPAGNYIVRINANQLTVATKRFLVLH